MTSMTCLALSIAVVFTAAGPCVAKPTDWPALGAALAEVIRTDPRAKAVYEPIQKLADAAMTDAPDPVARIRLEGLLAGDPLKERSTQSVRDMRKMAALAWCWLVSGEDRYATRAGVFLRAWADVNTSVGNPIDDTQLEQALFAYAIVRSKLADADRAAIDRWVRQAADAEMKMPTQENNWQDHRIKVVGMAGYALGDAEIIAFARKAWAAQLDLHLKPDGSTNDFAIRDALHYHVYSVDPLLKLAAAAGDDGPTLYHLASPAGGSLEHCVAFLRPFVTGEKTHIEFVHSTIAFDRKRAENKEPNFMPHQWEPKPALDTLVAASLFDSSWDEQIAKLAGVPEAKYASWHALVVSVRRPALPATRPTTP